METILGKMIKSKKYAGKTITISHLMLESCGKTEADSFLKSYGCNTELFKQKLADYVSYNEKVLASGFAVKTEASVSPSLNQVMIYSGQHQDQEDPDQATSSFRSFVMGLSQYGEETADTGVLVIMEDCGFDFNAFLKTNEQKENSVEELCQNLNDEALLGKIDPVIGREDEIRRTIEFLGKRKKNNVILIGDAGVGKTAIAEGLAQAIVEGKVPESLKNGIVYSLQVANMVADTSFRGQFEKKMMEMIEDFKKMEESGKTPILFIDEIHSIMGSGNNNGLDFANIIKPALSRGQLRCIGATTNAEWNKYLNQDKALKRRFGQIQVLEPTREQTVSILKGAKKYYEEKHQLTYSDEAIVRCVELSVEFINDSALPDKALDLMDYSGSKARIEGLKKVDDLEMEMALSRLRHIAPDVVRSKRVKQEFKPMAPEIKKYLFGQDGAVDSVVKSVEQSLAGLGEDGKPIGSFLMVGPTGVGKTELAKLVAKEMNAHLERIDMSEFMEAHSVSKLIGAPPGYVGHDAGSKLTQVFDKHPYVVLLLDEMEKAHPKVQEIFLQAMDNAKVTDSQGNPVAFHKALILMTSNAGAREMNDSQVGFIEQKASEKKIDMRSLKNHFLPELIGRLTGLIEFKGLDKEHMPSIVKKFLSKVLEGKLKSKGISLEVSDEAVSWFVEKGFSKEYGARNVEKCVRDHLMGEITNAILYGEIKDGKKKVKVSVKDNKLVFKYL